MQRISVDYGRRRVLLPQTAVLAAFAEMFDCMFVKG